jgi:Na+-transporting NADH:ubiquinone oxidoreductase subunit NqrC
MAVETGIIPEALDGMYFDNPDLPMPKETGLLDLIDPSPYSGSISGRSSVDPIQQSLQDFANQSTSMETLSAPRFFDYEATQADRYKQSDYFSALGFNPTAGVENEYKYGARQTWGDVWSNGLTGMFKLAGNTFIEGWKGWGNIVDAIASTSWDEAKQDLIGSPEYLMEQDKATKDIMNKYAIFATPESEEGVFNRKFFGDMLQQSGFAVGAIAQFLSEELLTWGLSTEFSLAKLGLRAPAWAGKVVTKADIANDLVKLGTPLWKSRSVAEGMVLGARKMIPFADTIYDMSKYSKAGAGALQIGAIGLGGLRRTLSEANMAMTEARMEAAGTYGELYNKLYDEHLFATGQAPDTAKLRMIEQSAKDAASDNFMVNTGILMLSNRMQFDNLFARFGVGRNVLGASGEFADDVLKVTGKKIGQEAAEKFTKTYAKGRFGTFGLMGDIAADFGKRRAAWEATKSFGKNIFKWEVSEGIQELLQEGSNKVLQDYYYDLYHGVKGGDFSRYIQKAGEEQYSTQGLKTFLMGAVTGRLLSPINFAVGQAKYYGATSAQQREERKTELATTVSTINAFYENPQSFLNEHIANVKVQDRAAKNMEEALANRDKYQFVNNKDGAFAKLMSSAMKTNMFKAITDNIRSYGETFNDDEFKEAFGINRTEENISSVKEYFNKIADETENFQKNWKALKEKFGDAVMLDLYKEGTPERKMALVAKRALDDALEILATNNYKATRAAERAVKLQTDMANIPALGNSAAAAFRNLAVLENTSKEIALLELEIKNFESIEKKDKATRELIKTKKEQLKALQNWSETYESLKGLGLTQKRKFKKAITAFEKYIKSKNLESGITQEVKLDQIEDIYNNLLDYIELNKDSKDYIDAYNILANPIKFAQVHKRFIEGIELAGDKLNKEHLQEAAKAATGPAAPQQPGAPSSEVPEFMQYLKDAWESQSGSGATDLPFDQWLNTPVAKTFTELYNKKYNKSEKIETGGDNISELQALKDDVLNNTLTFDFMESVFQRLSKILNLPIIEVEKRYEDFQNTLDPKEVEKDIADAKLPDNPTEEQVYQAVSRYLLPKFIDSLLTNTAPLTAADKSNMEVIELPALKIRMNKPVLFNGEKLVDDGKNGVFVIETGIVDTAKREELMKLMGADVVAAAPTSAFIVVNSDRNDPVTGSSDNLARYQKKSDALAARDEAIKNRELQDKKSRSWYPFAGQEVRAGLVLVENATGKSFVVDTKGEVAYSKDDKDKKEPYIRIIMLRNNSRTNSKRDITSLEGYTIKQKVEKLDTGEPVDPKIFRLVRTDELSRIYPYKAANEKKEDAQKRLDDLLKTTDAKELQAGLSITISENPGPRNSKNAGGTGIANPNLVQYGEKYQIQINYKGQPIGFLTNFDHYRFVTNDGTPVPMVNLTLNQFRSVFNSQGKDPREQMNLFKRSYENSRKVQAALVKYVKPGQAVTLTPEQTSKILNLYVGEGEFTFVPKPEKGLTYDELPYKTINGYYYILDRSKRYGKGYTFSVTENAITNAKGEDRKQIEKEIKLIRQQRDPSEQLGRYVAVVKLPNGKIRFIELNTDVMEDSQLNDFITKLNERSEITKRDNLQEGLNEKKEVIQNRKKIDFNEELNDELSKRLFLSVPMENRGTYINFSLTDTGNLELAFHKKVDDKDIRRSVVVMGKTGTDPISIKDINDLISRINAAIEKHDKSFAKREVDKIGFTLKRENFKQSTPDTAVIDDVKSLRSNVDSNVVKNIPLAVRASADLNIPEVNPKPQSSSTPPSKSGNGQVEIDPAMRAEFLKRLNAEQAGEGQQDTEEKPVETPLQGLYKELDNLKREKELEAVKRRDEKIASGKRASLSMIEANDEASAMYDKKIKEMQARINAEKNKNKGAALKVLDKPDFDQNSIVNIDKFRKYISRILGDKVSVQELEVLANNLKDNSITVGKFIAYMEKLQDGNPAVKGRIEVGANTPFKYHEAFHAVFRLMLPEAQVEKLLAYAKIEFKKSLKAGETVASKMADMRKLHKAYAEMTDTELEERMYEEWMADEFDSWKTQRDSKKVLPGVRGFFQKLWDLITSLFKGSRSELEGLFKEIDRGKYKNAKIADNRFTKPDALSISEPVLKAIQIGTIDVQDENGNFITIPKYLSQQEGDQIASTVASLFHTRALNSSDAGYNKMQLLNDIFADFQELYDVNGANREFYLDEADALFEQDPNLAKEYLSKLDQRHNIFLERENRKTLAEAVDTHLRVMGYQQELEDEEYTSMEDEFGSRVTTDNWKETHSIGGFGSLSKFLRQYIAATTYVLDRDEFGNTQMVNGEPLIQAVNANLVYSGILKAVANITDQKKFVNRLLELRNADTETGKFLNKFFDEVGLEVDPTSGEFSITNPKQATLFQMVLKGFQQYTVDYIFINKDVRKAKKVSRLMIANRMGAVKAQFTQWQNAYVQVFEEPVLRLRSLEERKEFAKERTGGLQDMLTNLTPSEYITDDELELESQRLSNQLKLDLGIAISPLYIKYSIAAAKNPDIKTEAQRKLTESYSDVAGINAESIKQLMKSVQALENPFAKNIEPKDLDLDVPGQEDAQEEKETVDDLGEGGAIKRINDLAAGNAVFDETVSTTSYKNAEGELVYAHQLPTYHLVKVNQFNNDEELTNMQVNDEFLQGNHLLQSDKFRSMSGDFIVERIEGMKSSILSEDEDGNLREDKTIQSNQNEGITYGSFSDREFIVSLLDLYAYNKEYKNAAGSFRTTQHLIRVIEASNTGDTVSLPVINAVKSDENGKVTLSQDALNILMQEVAREFERIKRVRREITTGIYENGEIEGYHYAVDGDGRRTSKKTPRGLKFYKMANMLGDLAAELEDASKNSSFDLSSRAADINKQIKKYWEDRMEEFVTKLDNLGVITTVKSENAEEDGELINNLVDQFLQTGFTVKADGKEVLDEKRNQDLNIVPGNIRHNLGQIMMNDYLNTLAINQLLYGDEARAFKDEVDQVKRAKGANGSGPSLESLVTNEELGITEAFTESYILTFTDPKYKANYAGGLKDKADAQSYQTVKSMRYTLHGLGKLTPYVAKILDKLERGDKLTKEEIFGPSGLKAMEAMFNSEKLVYFDGPQYIKTSTVMLTKELTSILVNGRWLARPGYEDLHDLRERMEKFEKDNNTVTFAAPKSASKGLKRNVFNHAEGFRNVKDDNFSRQETKYWRLQLVNPSNKLIITDPTQAKQIIIAEQDENTPVKFMGVNTTVGTLKSLYLSDTAQRVKNNYTRSRDEIFDIEEAFKELGKAIQQDKVEAKLEKFQKRAIETLRSTGADSQLIEFFSLDEETGKPKYNLNNPVTLEKYTQLFLAYFSKGVMSEKIPGHSLALMSNYGVKVVKVFTGRYDESGAPIGQVVSRDEVERNYSKYKNPKKWNNELDRQFDGLVEGDIYLDDLRHNVPEYDANGKIIGRYTEFMMPPHFMEDMGLKPGDPIPDHIARAFGVRIPSQDKHSFISLKLVDFLPAYYGSTGVFPHELIEISGADFDIDKLYMHIRDTYTKNGKRIAYGTATSAEGKFEEFVRWNDKNNKAFKDTLDELKENDPVYQELMNKLADMKRLEKDIDKAFENVQESDQSIRQGFNAAILSARLVDQVAMELVGMNPKLEMDKYDDEYGLIESAYFVKDLNEMLRTFEEKEKRDFLLSMGSDFFNQFKDLTADIADVESRLIGETLEALKLPNSITKYAEVKEELNNGVLNNRILDQKIAMLNNEHMVNGGDKAIAYQVASVDALKNLLDEGKEGNLLDLLSTGTDEKGNKTFPPGLGEILLEGGVDTDSMLGKYKAFKNNKEGSRNIGPAVNAMLVYAVLNNFGIQLRDTAVDPNTGLPYKMFKFKLNGHEFSGYNETRSARFEEGQFKGYDSERIFNTISTIVSAMTDNAKERLAARLGLNIEAVGYVSNMVAQGVPLQSAVMMMLQPVVREYFEMTKIASNNIKTGAESNIYKSQIAKELLKKYVDMAGEEYSKEDLTDEILVNNIKNNGSSATFQASVMEDFMGIMEQSKYYAAVAQVLKLTKGLGTSFEEYDAINEKIDMLGLRITNDKVFEKYVSQGQKSAPPFDLRQVLMGYDENKPYHTFIQRYIKIADQISEISKGMFLERTAVFKRIENIVKANLNVRPTLREKFNTDLKKDLLSYLSIKAYRKFLAENGRTGTLSTMTNALIYDQAAVEKGDKFKDIIDVIRLIRNKMPNNYLANNFLNMVQTTVVDASGNAALNPKNRDGINKIESNTWAKLSDYQVEKLRDSFIEIYQADEDFDGQGANGRDMANALFNYLLVKDGGQFRSGSFIRYVPNFMFNELLASTGKANDVMKLSVVAENVDQLNEEYKKVFGVTAIELFNEFMENYTTHVGNSYYVRKMNVNNETKFEPTGNEIVDKFEPQSLVSTQKGGLYINIFKGVREEKKAPADMTLEEQAGITWMTDEDYLEYVNSLTDEQQKELNEQKVKSNKFSDVEKAKFKKNMQSLRDKGFITNDKGEVEFPYIIKVSAGEMFKADQYFILKTVKKAKKDKTGKVDPKKLIQKDELVAAGVSAYYEPVERKGSRKTFKGAAMFDPIPETATLPRYRKVVTNDPNYSPYYQMANTDPEKEQLWMENHGFAPASSTKTTPAVKPVDTGSRSPKDVLSQDFAIEMKYDSSRKMFTFVGELYDMLPDDVKSTVGSNPQTLLSMLGYKPTAPAPQVKQTSQTSTASVGNLSEIAKRGISDMEKRNALMAAMFGAAPASSPEPIPGVPPPASAGTKVEDITISPTAAQGISDMEKYKELMRRMNGDNPLNDECAQQP